jgi:hypothetical protein
MLGLPQGGGLCELDNLRTLCVACHADVTRAQVGSVFGGGCSWQLSMA